MLGRFGWAEILVIVVLVVILFGSRRIPEMMKNLAEGMNIFKKEISKTKSADKAPKAEKTATDASAHKAKPAGTNRAASGKTKTVAARKAPVKVVKPAKTTKSVKNAKSMGGAKSAKKSTAKK